MLAVTGDDDRAAGAELVPGSVDVASVQSGCDLLPIGGSLALVGHQPDDLVGELLAQHTERISCRDSAKLRRIALELVRSMAS